VAGLRRGVLFFSQILSLQIALSDFLNLFDVIRIEVERDRLAPQLLEDHVSAALLELAMTEFALDVLGSLGQLSQVVFEELAALEYFTRHVTPLVYKTWGLVTMTGKGLTRRTGSQSSSFACEGGRARSSEVAVGWLASLFSLKMPSKAARRQPAK
jgi:hypothetical protein